MKRQAVATIASVVAAAATGVVTNVLSDNWALTWWLALGALVVVTVVLQLVISAQARNDAGSPVVGAVTTGRDAYVAGRDMTINHPPERRDSELELSSISLTETGPRHQSSAVLDLKIRNTGDQPAILHRAALHIHDAVSLSPYYTVAFLPYEEFWVRGALHVSQTYDIELPHPDEAAGTDHDLDLSQAIEPAGTDRFHLRLGIPRTQDTLVYQLSLDIRYDKHGTLSSPVIAVAHPPGSRLATAEEIRADIRSFRLAVREVRDAVDREMTGRGLTAPDWSGNSPTRRADLPRPLRSLDGDPGDPLNIQRGTYKVNDTFWNPDAAVAQHLREVHEYYRRVVRMIEEADVHHDALDRVLIDARTTLAELRRVSRGM